MPETIGITCNPFTKNFENFLLLLNEKIADFKNGTSHCASYGLQNIPETSLGQDTPQYAAYAYGVIARSVLPLMAVEKDTKEWPKSSVLEKYATPACWEFCNTRGLISDLSKCLDKAITIFSNRCNLMAECECFPVDEYEEEGHITIKAVVDCDQTTAFQKYDAFTEWMLDNIDDDKLSYFILMVERAE